MTPDQPRLFFLGATGYIGSQFLASAKRDASLYAKLKEFALVALVRDPDNAKAKQLQEVWPDVVLVKGTLDDLEIVEDQVRNATLTFNAADCDHVSSVQAIVTGLQKRSAEHPSDPKPLYIHTSGLGILSDNSRGEQLPADRIVVHSDTRFKLGDFPPTNPHHAADRIVHAAGAQKDNAIRAVSVYPGVVYGIGEGITTYGPTLKFLGAMYIQNGVAGTWGPGQNALSVVHIKDVGSALVKIFKLATEGAKDVDYFISSSDNIVLKRFTEVVGKVFQAHGLLQDGEPEPFPESVTNSFGDYGWSIFGGNFLATSDNLKAQGWEPTETAKVTIWDALRIQAEEFATAYKASRS
ncbi:hypothetical protein MD484_g6892, partial [Candolleomyces efflorescens]